jgi:hypothetical protein
VNSLGDTIANWPEKFPAYMSGDVQPHSRMSPPCSTQTTLTPKAKSLGDMLHMLYRWAMTTQLSFRVEISEPLIKTLDVI